VIFILLNILKTKIKNQKLILLALSSSGVIVALYLVSAEIISIKAICLWCSSLHIVLLSLFLTALYSYLKEENTSKENIS
jgi:uncharacterized membrane protein